MRKILACLLALILLFALSSTALAATYSVVDPTQLSDALSAALPGDRIDIAASFAMTTDGVIPAKVTLTVPAGVTFTLSNGAKLTNRGAVHIAGTLQNADGRLNNAGTLVSSGGLINGNIINNTGAMVLSGTVTPGTINLSGGGKLTNNTAAAIPVSVNGVAQAIPVGDTATAYTVTFDGNGATSGSTAAQSALAGSTITLNSNGFIKRSCVFAGWNTAANGTGTAYAEQARITLNANATLYAQWTVAGGITAGNNQMNLSSVVSSDPAKASIARQILANPAFQAPMPGLAEASYGCIPMDTDEYASVYLKATVSEIINPGTSTMRVVYDVGAYYQKYINGTPVGGEGRLSGFNGQIFYVRLPIPYIISGYVQVEQDGTLHTLPITGTSAANAYVAVPSRYCTFLTLRYDGAAVPAATSIISPGTTGAVTVAATTTTAPVAAITTTAVVGVPATGEEPSSIWMLLSMAVLMGVSWILVKKEA